MDTRHVIVIGGGLAGLSAGAYARASGFRTTVIEHNEELGGVCTAWHRGPYLIDGCIHWLTGGPYDQVYRELGILQQLQIRPLRHFTRLRDVRDGTEVDVISDLRALEQQLVALAPEDKAELGRLFEAAPLMTNLIPSFEKPQELQTLKDGVQMLWGMRSNVPLLFRFRQSIGDYVRAHFKNPRVARMLKMIVGDEAPAMFLLMVLGYLQKGWLSRPVGGTEAFRNAAIQSYRRLGGNERLHSTVDEILIRNGRAIGVALSDGELLKADDIICTSSAPETLYRLLGGRYGMEENEKRLAEWKLFTPIVLASYGVELPLKELPQMLQLDGIAPIEVGGRVVNRLYLRIYNDDPAFAPVGHSVLQVLAETDYDWWATRGADYQERKDEVAKTLLAVLDQHLPGVMSAARLTDVSTPLTYWNMARSWRGAYEGWMPTSGSMFTHVRKTLKGLGGFYMAGQWVEPGGGVPTACASGRAAVQLLCADEGHSFATPIDVAGAIVGTTAIPSRPPPEPPRPMIH